MNHTFYQHKHEVEGDIHFELDERKDRVRFCCHWPFDRAANEWIDLGNEFSAREFQERIGHLSRSKRIHVPGVSGGGITLRVLNRNTIEFDVVGTKDCHEEFTYEIPAKPSDLFLMKNGHRLN